MMMIAGTGRPQIVWFIFNLHLSFPSNYVLWLSYRDADGSRLTPFPCSPMNQKPGLFRDTIGQARSETSRVQKDGEHVETAHVRQCNSAGPVNPVTTDPLALACLARVHGGIRRLRLPAEATSSKTANGSLRRRGSWKR